MVKNDKMVHKKRKKNIINLSKWSKLETPGETGRLKMASLLNKVKNVIFKEPILPISVNLNEKASKLLSPGGKWRTAQFNVDSDWKNVRLDRLLTKKFDISASLAQKLIRTRKVWIEWQGKSDAKIKVSAALRLEAGDSVNLSEIFLPERKTSLGPLSKAQEDHLKEWTIHEDDSLLVLNKPSGLAVHSGPGVKVSLDELLKRRSEANRLIHRLDRGTSGVILVGKTRIATEEIQNLFKQTTVTADAGVKKTYLALVAGTPKDRVGTIKTTIYQAKKSFGPGAALEPQMTTERSKRADVLDEGSVAVTDYKMISSHMTKVKGIRVKLSLMEFTPQTGRTHQIRVHAAEQLGCPIVGDNRYGLTTIFNLSRIPGIGQGLHLHCKSIELPSKKLKFDAPIPKHFIKTLNKFPIRIKPPRPTKKIE